MVLRYGYENIGFLVEIIALCYSIISMVSSRFGLFWQILLELLTVAENF